MNAARARRGAWIALGVFAAIVCAPINERPLARPAAAPA